jgi:hypothetical protein
MPHHWPIDASREKLRECLYGSFLSSAKDVLAPLDGHPFPNLIHLEAQRVWIGHLRFPQIMYWNCDAGLAVARPERDSLRINMKIPGLIPESPNALDLQVECVRCILREAQVRGHCQQGKYPFERHAASLASFRTSKPFQIS